MSNSTTTPPGRCTTALATDTASVTDAAAGAVTGTSCSASAASPVGPAHSPNRRRHHRSLCAVVPSCRAYPSRVSPLVRQPASASRACSAVHCLQPRFRPGARFVIPHACHGASLPRRAISGAVGRTDTFAEQRLAHDKVPLHVVSRWMGHSKVELTSKQYGDYAPDNLDQWAHLPTTPTPAAN